MTEEDAKVLRDKLLELVPMDGTTKGNVTLRTEWLDQEAVEKLLNGNSDDDNIALFWLTRNYWVESGTLRTGRGKGGSVARTLAEAVTVEGNATATVSMGGQATAESIGATEPESEPEALTEGVKLKEKDLYLPCAKTITQNFAPSELPVEPGKFIVGVTGLQGKRDTGGKWTRPDITVVSVRRFKFTGPYTEVFTFEVKKAGDVDIDGVHEALAHSAKATKVYYLGQVPEEELDEFLSSPLFARIQEECIRFGVGFVTFSAADDYATWSVQVPAMKHAPHPEKLEKFLHGTPGIDGSELEKLLNEAYAPTAPVPNSGSPKNA